MTNKSDWILEHSITGYRQYVLNQPVHLEFASQNLCDILGAEKSELENDDIDLYINWVHPADRESYSIFINNLSEKQKLNTLQYRLVTQNNRVIYVSDSVTVVKNEDGILMGMAVLTDISTIKSETEALQFLNDTIPCGFLKYTCDKHPRVTYLNKRMLEMLGFSSDIENDDETLEMYCSNLFLMIQPEERRKFSHYLNRVYAYEAPLAGEINILRCDGTRGVFFGWVTKCVNEHGEEEFQSVCIDVSKNDEERKNTEISRYLKALTDVYEIIFEYDLGNKTVKCLHAPHSDSFMKLVNIPMQMRESTDSWLKENVYEEDRELFSNYFHSFFDRNQEDDSDFSQITYRAFTSKGYLKTYIGQFLKISSSISLFCCRKIKTSDDSAELKSEIVSLKNTQELVMQFFDGVTAFEISGDFVRPLYISENVSSFFGYNSEEWLAIMKKPIPLHEFIMRSKLSYDKILETFKNGQGEFKYYDIASQKEKTIKAICSKKTTDDKTPRYIMLYEAEKQPAEANKNVSIRTFGYFDVFVFGKPIAFRSEKSKELLALLVDRKGGFISSKEAIGFLWPDEPANSVTMSRYRKVALRLKNILAEYGASEIIETVDGKRRIIPEKVQCDLYDYLTGDEKFALNFKGSYLINYSWGEITLGELLGENIAY